MAKSIQTSAAPPATRLPAKFSTESSLASSSTEGSGRPASNSSICMATRR